MTGQLVTVQGAELVEGRIHGQGVAQNTSPWFRVRKIAGATPVRLLDGEQFILAVRSKHWCVPARQSFGTAIMWPIVFTANLLAGLLPFTVWPIQIAMWAWAVGHSMHKCHLWLSWSTDVIVITNRRMLQLSGIFSNTVDGTMLHQIRRFKYHQGFFGQLFRYGDLRIELDGVHDDGANREISTFVPDVANVYHAMLEWLTQLETVR